MVLIALACGALTGRMDAVAKATTDSASSAVALAIGLVGTMAFWIGAMQVLHKAGVLRWIALLLQRPMRWLFPEVPADHPATSMMIMNMTSNMLGLGNAATPFGLKAMLELDKLNEHRGTASDSMALFLAINTSNLALLPTGIIALRASLGADAPGSIFIPTLVATSCSTGVAIVVAKLLARWRIFSVRRALRGVEPEQLPAPVVDEEGRDLIDPPDTTEAEAAITASPPLLRGWRLGFALQSLAVVAVSLAYGVVELTYGTPTGLFGMKSALNAGLVSPIGAAGAAKTVASSWPLPLLIGLITFLGLFRGVNIYDCIVEGGKEGFQIAIKIIPYLVAILVAVGMLRASGFIDLGVALLDPATSVIGMPAEVLPMAMLRSLSGSGAYAIAGEIMQTHGTDTMIGNIVSTMQGSTETTFYVMALYFGVIQVRRVRHTLVACLIADTAGILAAVWAVRIFL